MSSVPAALPPGPLTERVPAGRRARQTDREDGPRTAGTTAIARVEAASS